MGWPEHRPRAFPIYMQVAHRTEPTLVPRRPVGRDVDTKLPRTEAGGGEQAANLDQLHRRRRLSQDPPF